MDFYLGTVMVILEVTSLKEKKTVRRLPERSGLYKRGFPQRGRLKIW